MPHMLDYRIDMEPRSQWEIISVNEAAKQNLLYVQELGLFTPALPTIPFARVWIPI